MMTCKSHELLSEVTTTLQYVNSLFLHNYSEFEIDVTGVSNDNIDMLNITFKETLKSPPADNMLTALTGRTMQVCNYYCRWNAKKNKYYKKCSRMSKKGFCKFCRKTICNSGAIIS
ncbi:uncharacterized protein LOC120338405 isoform X1 [Styela clava]